MNSTERLEKLKEIFDELSDIRNDQAILVEGAKDRMALALAGISGITISVQSDGGPLKVAERLSDERLSAVILTDWDKEGEHIAKELERALSSLCVRYDTKIRSKLRSVCGNEIYDIESLPAFYSRLVTESIRKKEGRNK